MEVAVVGLAARLTFDYQGTVVDARIAVASVAPRAFRMARAGAVVRDQRENGIVRIRTALSSDGLILGRDVDVLMDNGAYSGEMLFMASLPMHVFGQVYRAGAARIRCRLVYTNTPPTGAFRGLSGTYPYFALERHMDECALRLGIDRRQFRLENLIRSGDASLVGQVLEDADILTEAFDGLDHTFRGTR